LRRAILKVFDAKTGFAKNAQKIYLTAFPNILEIFFANSKIL
jgi:hypothetical protein